MREIKFRVWDIACNKMRDWNWIMSCEYPFLPDNTNMSSLLDTNQFYLMQFTGLYDKNKTPIYEGDILKDHSGYKWKVYWHEDHACFAVMSLQNKVVSEVIDNLNMEVIGTIHQNPEL